MICAIKLEAGYTSAALGARGIQYGPVGGKRDFDVGEFGNVPKEVGLQPHITSCPIQCVSASLAFLQLVTLREMAAVRAIYQRMT